MKKAEDLRDTAATAAKTNRETEVAKVKEVIDQIQQDLNSSQLQSSPP